MGFNSGKCTLKYRKKDNVYKNSTGTCFYDVDLKIAKSYDWWTFVKTIKNKVVFNNFNYSVSTSAHQSAVRSLLKELGIKIDVYIDIKDSLDNSNALKFGIENAYKVLFLEQLMSPRRRSKKTWRYTDIKELQKNIDNLRSIGAKCSKKRQLELKIEVQKADEDKRLKAQELSAKIRANKMKSLDTIKDKLNDTNELDLFNINDKFNNLNSI